MVKPCSEYELKTILQTLPLEARYGVFFCELFWEKLPRDIVIDYFIVIMMSLVLDPCIWLPQSSEKTLLAFGQSFYI